MNLNGRELVADLVSTLLFYLQPIMDSSVSTLLQGEHTRSIVKKTPTARAGGIMMFAVKKLKVGIC